MNRKDLEEKKVQWIKDNIPNYKAINPILDITTISTIKYAMCDAGLLYTKDSRLPDTGIVNYLLIAQGKRKIIAEKRKNKKERP